MAPVVILEGLNGVGKSALAKLLCPALGLKTVRCFRRDASQHLGRGDVRNRAEGLRAMGVPANTFVDDIYVAELMVTLGAGGLLDRSMGSAIAYGLLYNDIPGPGRAAELLTEWQETWLQHPGPVLYVYLVAEPGVLAKRCAGRWSPDEKQTAQLKRMFDFVYENTKLPKVCIDTSALPDALDSASLVLKTLQDAQAR